MCVLNIKNCKCSVSNYTNMGSFKPFDVVGRVSETQLDASTFTVLPIPRLSVFIHMINGLLSCFCWFQSKFPNDVISSDQPFANLGVQTLISFPITLLWFHLLIKQLKHLNSWLKLKLLVWGGSTLDCRCQILTYKVGPRTEVVKLLYCP